MSQNANATVKRPIGNWQGPSLRLERAAEIVTVTIDRDKKLNAIDAALWKDLTKAFDEISADHSIRCVVLTGTGNRAFSSGADISEFPEQRFSAASAQTYEEMLTETWRSLRICRHPIIAMIDGLCVGGGLVLACCADMRVASRRSRFGVPAKNLGAVVPHAEVRPILDLIGPAHTLALLLHGGLIDADEAHRIDLINMCVAPSRLRESVQELVRSIAEGAPLAARLHKRIVRRLLHPGELSEGEIAECFACFDSVDYAEGLRAFLTRTRPSFSGT